MDDHHSTRRKRGRPTGTKEIDFDKVLDIAITTFAANGYEGTRLNTIAQEAGYAKSLMNYHFKGGKEELWKKAISKLALKLHERFQVAEG